MRYQLISIHRIRFGEKPGKTCGLVVQMEVIPSWYELFIGKKRKKITLYSRNGIKWMNRHEEVVSARKEDFEASVAAYRFCHEKLV